MTYAINWLISDVSIQYMDARTRNELAEKGLCVLTEVGVVDPVGLVLTIGHPETRTVAEQVHDVLSEAEANIRITGLCKMDLGFVAR